MQVSRQQGQDRCKRLAPGLSDTRPDALPGRRLNNFRCARSESELAAQFFAVLKLHRRWTTTPRCASRTTAVVVGSRAGRL